MINDLESESLLRMESEGPASSIGGLTWAFVVKSPRDRVGVGTIWGGRDGHVTRMALVGALDDANISKVLNAHSSSPGGDRRVS